MGQSEIAQGLSQQTWINPVESPFNIEEECCKKTIIRECFVDGGREDRKIVGAASIFAETVLCVGKEKVVFKPPDKSAVKQSF